jgi:hypothetical protein
MLLLCLPEHRSSVKISLPDTNWVFWRGFLCINLAHFSVRLLNFKFFDLLFSWDGESPWPGTSDTPNSVEVAPVHTADSNQLLVPSSPAHLSDPVTSTSASPFEALSSSLRQFATRQIKQRSASLRKERKKKPIPVPETTPVSRRTRGSIKRTASMGDLSHYDVNSVQSTPSVPSTDKTLMGLNAQLKKRREDLLNEN